MSKTVADHLWERLGQWNVERVFGYPGDGINGIMGALGRVGQQVDVPTIFGLGANYTNSERDSYGTLNLRGGIKTDHWSLVAFATNVTKERYLAEVIVAPEFGGAFVAPGALRTIGVEATFKF